MILVAPKDSNAVLRSALNGSSNMNLSQIREVLESFAPLSWQESYDNSGLQLGLFNNDGQADSSTPVRGVLLCLDITEAVVEDAIEKGWVVKWKQNSWMRNKKERASNVDLWERLLLMLEKHQVKFIWVKGHAGHPENERCDQLATSAADGDNLIHDEVFEKER